MSEDKSSLFSVYIKDGIIFCIYHQDIVVDVYIMRAIITRRIELSEGKYYPIFIDARDVKYWTLEARKYGFSKEAHQFASAYGILENSSIIRTIVNWALKVFPNKIPLKLFTKQEEALQWLRKFVDKEHGLKKQSKPLLVL